MKTKVLISALVILMAAFFTECKKDSDDSGPLLEGDFSGTFNLEGDVFPFYFNDVEQDGEKLSGSFEFTDGSGYAPFSSLSKLEDDALKINFSVSSGGYTITFDFTGVVNAERTTMNGSNLKLTMSGVGIDCGAWSATKTSTKSADIAGVKSASKGNLQKLLTLLKDLE